MNKQRWSLFLKGNDKDNYYTSEPDLLHVCWDWLFTEYRGVIEPIYRCMDFDQEAVRNVVVPTLHNLLNPSNSKIDVERLDRLKGTYALYRPHHLDPTKAMVMSMTCGMADDVSRFVLSMCYEDEDGDRVHERVQGFALPCGDSVLFQGALERPHRQAAHGELFTRLGVPFIFVLTNFFAVAGEPIRVADGALLVGSNGGLPTTYRMVMRRAKDAIEPKVVAYNDLRLEAGMADIVSTLMA